MALLRARHETSILGLAETVKYSQWQEAIKSREALEKSLANAAQRYVYYERQLGKQETEIAIPELDGPDVDGLAKMKFKSAEPKMESRGIEMDIAQGAEGAAGGKKISSHELLELTQLEGARSLQDASALLDLLGKELSLLP